MSYWTRIKNAWRVLRGKPQYMAEVKVTVDPGEFLIAYAEAIITLNTPPHWNQTHHAHKFFQNHPKREWLKGSTFTYLKDADGMHILRTIKLDWVPFNELEES